jgi:iron complex transport system permease protein
VRSRVVTCALLAVALAFGVLVLGTGDYPLTPAEVLRTLSGGGDAGAHFVVWELRLPRVLTALAAGAALALSGALFQALVRNPLGSPDVLGFTSGAATGALVSIVVLGGSSTVLAGGAVAGAVLSGAVVLLASRRGPFVLAGVATAAVLTGVNGYLLTRAQLMDAARAVLWLTGSLDGRDWSDVRTALGALVLLAPVAVVGYGRALRLLELGDDSAAALGVRVPRTRYVLLSVAVLLAAAAAAACGPVSFVALAAPQLARRLTRTPGPNLVPSAAMGAALLVAADWLSQRAVPGHALPVGVLTGLLGGGYLVWLLASHRRVAAR